MTKNVRKVFEEKENKMDNVGCQQESVIARAVSVIDEHNEETNNVIVQLEKRLEGVLSPSPVQPETAKERESTNCQLEERLRQAGNRSGINIDYLQTIISRLQL